MRKVIVISSTEIINLLSQYLKCDRDDIYLETLADRVSFQAIVELGPDGELRMPTIRHRIDAMSQDQKNQCIEDFWEMLGPDQRLDFFQNGLDYTARGKYKNRKYICDAKEFTKHIEKNRDTDRFLRQVVVYAKEKMNLDILEKYEWRG